MYHGRYRPFSSGFSLLELMVVIAIIAIATAGVSFALRDGQQVAADREAERLAALLESARSQSRAGGMAVRWRPVAGSFVFDGLPADALPTGWLGAGVEARITLGDGSAVPALVLGPDPIIAAQQVSLAFEGPPARTLQVATDGLRPFTVASP